MSFIPYIIEIKVEVVAKEGCHYAQDWVSMTASECCYCFSFCETNEKPCTYWWQ